jgi:hypothetical protein
MIYHPVVIENRVLIALMDSMMPETLRENIERVKPQASIPAD